MAELMIEDAGWRKARLDEILGDENRQRKEDSKTRFEVYRDRQDKFVEQKLQGMFSPTTVKEMRKITSINFTKRIVNEKASIFKTEPDREFFDSSGEKVDEKTMDQIQALYDNANANVRYKRANQYFKLEDQCALQIWPRDGIIDIRVLAPHHYDVIPDPQNPEIGRIYILSVMDETNLPLAKDQDLINQGIADRDDAKRKKMRFVWWSKDVNFTTDGNGAIVSTELDENGNVVPVVRPNPIGMLPFIDIFDDKDFEFWVRKGSATVGFNLDFSCQISDLATIISLQGYAQAIITGENIPDNITVGPNRIIRLPTTSGEAPPTFEFATPNPDLKGGLEFLDMLMNLFLTAEGLDPKLISATGDSKSFSSGVERFLAEISKFSATKDDFDVFKGVEDKAFDLFRAWSNELQGTDDLIPELQGGQLDEGIDLVVKFAQPEMMISRAEKEASIEKRLSLKLMTRIEAIEEDRGVDAEQAKMIAEEIDNESLQRAQNVMKSLIPNQPPEENEDDDDKDGDDKE